MTVLLIGLGVLGFVLGLFYLKDRLKNRTLARIAHSDLVMRFTVIGVALIAVGPLFAIEKLIS
jgi:uncharacterized membrane protein